MQWLTLVPEDAGTRLLKADNRRPATTPGVDAVAPYPRVHSLRLGDHPEQTLRPPARDRRSGDRRQNERRQKQVPVILDTRCKHDRRALENRRESTDDTAAASVPARINLYA